MLDEVFALDQSNRVPQETVDALASRFRIGGFDLLALRLAQNFRLPMFQVVGDLFACPMDGLCDDLDRLQEKMLRLDTALGGSNQKDDCSPAWGWGKLYFDGALGENQSSRVWAHVFPDPEVALAVAKAKQESTVTVHKGFPVQLVNEELRAVFDALDPANYSTLGPSRMSLNREEGHRFVYPGGRVLTIVRSATGQGHSTRWSTRS